MTDRSFSYYVVALDYGKRGIEAIVDPETTRRDVIACIRSGEYRNISFIHLISMGELPEDVTQELIDAADLPDREEFARTIYRIDAQFDHARDLRKNWEPV